MATFRHILAATDFSEASARALELARSLAAECGAELTIVYVCEVPGYAEDAPIPYERLTPIVEEAQARLDAIVDGLRSACPRANALVKLGGAWEQLLAAAAETHADLIVLGTHGRRGFRRALIGSVAERVVRLSPIPVLTVRSNGGGGSEAR